MPVKQKIFALVICCLVFICTVELVRKRLLKEEYSVLWLCTSTLMFFLVLKYNWLVALTDFIGAGLPTSTLFLCSIVFLMLIAVQFSVKISQMSVQIKNLAQDNAVLRAELEQVQQGREGEDRG